ncbi:MAG TPA: hypothetical protein PKA78_08380 [Macellibacteroides fermentans]|uniref:hypothetical protein n=1 Tax=Macellibacteroides fermentans TaxID=879969 RepID=UPI002C653D20|nr:hypothetical protein [Macellibacteroides fermentans]
MTKEKGISSVLVSDVFKLIFFSENNREYLWGLLMQNVYTFCMVSRDFLYQM